ncbi:MAG: MutS-related protein [Rectinemataceae bacterium]
MVMHSMLFEDPAESAANAAATEPEFFGDLNLGRIVDAITAGRQEYDLKPFFYAPLHGIDAIAYRHEIFRDLEDGTLRDCVVSFEKKMHLVRERLTRAKKLYYNYQKESFSLDSTILYCEAVEALARDLAGIETKSRGFAAFRRYLSAYVRSEAFASLLGEAREISSGLSAVRYCFVIDGTVVKVRDYESEIDYGADVEATFEKFKQSEAKDYLVDYEDRVDMNHIEAQILDFVARLHRDLFLRLDAFCAKNALFLDDTIAAFDREIQFYLAYMEQAERLERSGLRFCYPRISDTGKEIFANDCFDMALAGKLSAEGSPVVCNDFFLEGRERIIVVSGPNQGGKTTFARSFGQLHFLAAIGCTVPGREARLFLFDRLFTHFEREEDSKDLRGKLQDDLLRIHAILENSSSNSVLVLNEIFNSTTLSDAVFLGKEIMKRMMSLDLLCVYVTFLDELASMSEKTVSMVSTVVPENPAMRTYKILRRPADGLAYALSIAEKHRLTYECLKERIET